MRPPGWSRYYHLHITGDEATLALITPDGIQFPPQNCLIDNALQASSNT